MLVIKHVIDINKPDNHIRLAFFYFQHSINFVLMDRYYTYEQTPFNVLNLIVRCLGNPGSPLFSYYPIPQSP